MPNRSFESASATVAVAASAVVASATAALGPIIAVGALGGVMIGITVLLSPLTGLVFTIFANTCFQVLGSSHIIGLPLSASRLLAAMTLGSWLLRVFLKRSAVVASSQWIWVMGILAVIILWDMFLPRAGFQGIVRFASVLVLYILVANISAQSENALNVTVAGLMAALGVAGVIGIAEHFLPAFAIESDDPELAQGAVGGVLDRESLEGVVIKRITGGLGDANWLSYSLAAAMPLALYLWFRFPTLLARSVIAGTVLLQMFGLVLSYTRTGFLGLGVAVLYLLLRRALPVKYVALGGVVLGVAGLIYMPPGLIDRFFSSSYLQEGSSPVRQFFVSRAVDAWVKSPIVGHGYAGFGRIFYESVKERLPADARLYAWSVDLTRAVEEGREHVENIGAHNLYLEILTEYGLVGFVVFAALIIAVFADLRWIERNGRSDQRLLAICIGAGLLGFLACGALGHAKFLKVPWMLFGLTVALRVIVRTEGGQAASGRPAPPKGSRG